MKPTSFKMVRGKSLLIMTVGWICFPALRAQNGESLHVLKFKNQKQIIDYFHYSGHEQPIISGHRGGALADYPENSIATFEHTLAATSAVFEIDPHLTKDSAMVLLHDPFLERVTTGHGKLNSYTLNQLNQFYLKDLLGEPTHYHLNTLKEAIEWCKGKTMLNLDVKDVPILMKARMVKELNAFNYVMFTVHDSKEAKAFYDFDSRSFFSAWILTTDALKAYESSGVPWSHILMAYVGPAITAENKALCQQLHDRGVMVMVGLGPSDDLLPDAKDRADAYRKAIGAGADIIESDRPIEVCQAIKGLYPAKAPQYKYQRITP